MFKLLGRFTVAHAWKICAAWLIVGVVLTWAAPAWNTKAQDDDIHFLPARCDSVRGYNLLARAFPQDVFASRVVFAVERADRCLDEADLALVDRIVADLNQLRQEQPQLGIGQVHSRRDAFIGKRMLSADGQCALIQVSLGTPFLALQTRDTVDRADAVVRQRLAEAGADAPRLYTTGPAGVGRDLIRAGADSLDGTTIATIVLVVVVLLLVYRAPLLALVPVVTIAASVWVALKLLALFTLVPGIYLVNISKIFAIVLLYGAGTDYCLFLISRYREELGEGLDRPSAIRRSVVTVGGALAASAGTVICGLGLMGCAEFAKVRCAGPAIALSLAVALAGALTLTPALLHLLGEAAFWPRSLGTPRLDRVRLNFWNRISAMVVARPGLVLGLAAVAILPLALLGYRVRSNYKPTGELSPACGSVAGLEVIQRHFTVGEVGPVTVLLSAATDWNSPEGRALIDHLSRGFACLDNVAEVRSLTQPLGSAMPASPEPASPGDKGMLTSLFNTVQRNVDGVRRQADQAARDFYIASLPPAGQAPGQPRFVTRLDVVMRSDPFAPESVRTLAVIQAWLREELPRSRPTVPGFTSECYGVTVNARDLAQVTESDRKRINVLVLVGVFVILLVVVRRPWLAAYLLATVLFSYFATLGATTLMAHGFMGRPLGELDWRVSFFLFTILVAVGEDYNILLVTRIFQERRRHGTEEGTRIALARTGGTITCCGLIMAGTFATLMLAGLGTLVQVGFALAFGVLFDTFIVRPFLVPSFLLSVWRVQRILRQQDNDRQPTWQPPSRRRRVA